MKKYSILIVGLKCYSGHIREFIINLKKKNPLVDITLIATYIQDDYRENIEQSVNQLIILKKYKGKVRIPYLTGLINWSYFYWAFLKLYFKRHFDIVDIHFPKVYVKHALPILRRMTNNLIITPWGSDVMRVKDENSIKVLTKIYSQARYITIGRDSSIGKCAIAKFKVNPEKMIKLGWGGEFFDYIQENSGKVTTEEAKKRFGIANKFVITCGYNMQSEQRHEDIIDAIYSIKGQLPNNLLLLFPFTYAINEKHIKHKESIIEKCKTLGLEATVIEEHLDLADLFKLRMATDIFVHVQDTDSGSRCVMEYVYCNKKIVHGAWVRYAYLEEHKPSCYFPVDKIENLGSIIVTAYQSEIKELPQVVKDIILERGWSNRMTKWNDFFESMVS